MLILSIEEFASFNWTFLILNGDVLGTDRFNLTLCSSNFCISSISLKGRAASLLSCLFLFVVSVSFCTLTSIKLWSSSSGEAKRSGESLVASLSIPPFEDPSSTDDSEVEL